jgi:hypothetical protein
LTDQELMHVIDVHLAERAWAPATLHRGGAICFQVSQTSFAAARVMPSARVEVFCSPGYVDDNVLQALVEDVDEDVPIGGEELLIRLFTWRSGDAEWRAEVSFDDGMLVVARIAPAPESVARWVEGLETFDRACCDWAACLSPLPPGVDAGGLADLISQIQERTR